MEQALETPQAYMLIKAVKLGHAGRVQLALNGGGSPNVGGTLGMTALHWAAELDLLGITEMLLQDHGVDPTVRCKDGRTALMFAAGAKNAMALGPLLNRGGVIKELNMTCRAGFTALGVSAAQGHDKAATMLLQARADPDIKDTFGWTALMHAVHQYRPDTARVLLDGGADGDVQNNENGTAFTIARYCYGQDCEMITDVLQHYDTSLTAAATRYGVDAPAYVDNDDMFFCAPQHGHPGGTVNDVALLAKRMALAREGKGQDTEHMAQTFAQQQARAKEILAVKRAKRKEHKAKGAAKEVRRAAERDVRSGRAAASAAAAAWSGPPPPPPPRRLPALV